MTSVCRVVLLLAVFGSVVNCSPVGIIHMHGVTEGYYEHVNFKKFIEGNTGIPVHLLDVSVKSWLDSIMILELDYIKLE